MERTQVREMNDDDGFLLQLPAAVPRQIFSHFSSYDDRIAYGDSYADVPDSMQQRQGQAWSENAGNYASADSIPGRGQVSGVSFPSAQNAARTAQGIGLIQEFEIIRKLGSGSTAEVYLVKSILSGQLFALKEIQMNYIENHDKIENELTINLEYRDHVVQCFKTFSYEGKIYIVLEYMDGGSMDTILQKKGRFPEPVLAEIAKQALQGLLSLHKGHIIHRDIKPSNMLLNKKGLVKITDFGVSTLLTSTMDVGISFVGTCTYMAPERISCQPHSYNSDTWSLALSILEFGIGRFPYQPSKGPNWANFFDLLNTVVKLEAPVAPKDEFSPEFCLFISQCLEKDPSKRLTVAQALEHPFLMKYKDEVDLSGLCD